MLKTKKGVRKRFRITKSGKIKYNPSGKSHLQTNKEAKRVRKLRKARILQHKKESAYLKKMLPYG
ncbi:MAG: 50S ribosomal protein L35 [Candidatus Omnitrophica bacterium]|nr:50S ribosomal protein L35 [Candidatus Omnitrophota bacterium]